MWAKRVLWPITTVLWHFPIGAVQLILFRRSKYGDFAPTCGSESGNLSTHGSSGGESGWR